MSNEILNKLATVIETHLKDTGITQNALAEEIGIASSYLTHAIKRNWDQVPAGKDASGNPRVTRFSDAIAKKIRIYFRIDESKIWEIRNYQIGMNLLFECKEYTEHRIIDGLRGSGKSFVATEFSKQAHTNTFLIKASEDMNPKSLMEELGKQVGVDTTKNRRVIRLAIGEKLKKMVKPLIIIDECENLKPAAFAAIKALYDDVEDYCGITLIGANNFLDFIKKKALANKGCFPQLWSRFSADPAILYTITKDDVRMIASLNGITDTNTINTLYQTCQDYRELDRTIKRIVREQEVLNVA